MSKIRSLGNLQSPMGMRFSDERFNGGLDLLVTGRIQIFHNEIFLEFSTGKINHQFKLELLSHILI